MSAVFALAVLASGPKYKPIKGVAFHLCSCSAPCPCMRSKGGDMEDCQLSGVYHFTDGGYVGKHLDGLTMVVVARPKALIERDKKNGVAKPIDLAVYLPKGASAKQEQDLKFVLVEHEMRFAWGNFSFRKVPIEYRKEGSGYVLTIPGILSARTNPMLDGAGKPRVVDHVHFEEGSRWHLGKTSAHRYTDPKEQGWRWSYPANNGAWCFFSWERIDHP